MSIEDYVIGGGAAVLYGVAYYYFSKKSTDLYYKIFSGEWKDGKQETSWQKNQIRKERKTN